MILLDCICVFPLFSCQTQDILLYFLQFVNSFPDFFYKLIKNGVGRGNRTLTTRSEAWDSAIKLYPQSFFIILKKKEFCNTFLLNSAFICSFPVFFVENSILQFLQLDLHNCLIFFLILHLSKSILLPILLLLEFWCLQY